IAAPIARSALSANPCEERWPSGGRVINGVEGRREPPEGWRNRLAGRRLTLRVSAMINTRYGIPVFTGNDRSSRHPEACSPSGVHATCGRASRAAKGADCKPAGLTLRRFESYLSHHLEIAKQFENPPRNSGHAGLAKIYSVTSL